MFRNQRLIKPKSISLLLTLIIAFIAFASSQSSAFIGYLIALLALLTIIIAMHTKSIWPTKTQVENPFIFSLFWGLMVGLLLPFLIATYLDGGLKRIYEMIMK